MPPKRVYVRQIGSQQVEMDVETYKEWVEAFLWACSHLKRSKKEIAEIVYNLSPEERQMMKMIRVIGKKR